MTARRTLLLALSLAAALSGCNGSKSTAANIGESTIAQYVAAIDSHFEDMKGRQFGDNPIVTKYLSKLTIPNTNACVISHVKRSGDTIASCFFVSGSQSAADAAFVAAKSDVKAAAPQLAGGDEPPTNGNLAQFMVKDAAHAVYVDESRQDDGKYTVVTSFGTPAALQ
jgi:hypothetical protein